MGSLNEVEENFSAAFCLVLPVILREFAAGGNLRVASVSYWQPSAQDKILRRLAPPMAGEAGSSE